MHIQPTQKHSTVRRGVAIGSLALVAFGILPAASASADGGNGASYCSNQGPPTGEFAGNVGDDSTYGNAGEVVSWFTWQGLRPIGPWGQTVKDICDPKAP